MGFMSLCVVESLFCLVLCFVVVSYVVCFIFLLFDVICTSSCSGSTVPLALYVLLCGSGSSLLRGSVMYVIGLPIHGVISPVRTYRRCILDIWSTWR